MCRILTLVNPLQGRLLTLVFLILKALEVQENLQSSMLYLFLPLNRISQCPKIMLMAMETQVTILKSIYGLVLVGTEVGPAWSRCCDQYICQWVCAEQILLRILLTNACFYFSGSNNLYPGDIIPFTRRPLFLIIDSDNSHAFKAGLS